MDTTYFYHGLIYKWNSSKADKTFLDDHITIKHCCQAIFDCPLPTEQHQYHPPRWKYVGMSEIGVITVITEEDETRIVTAWRSSKEEVIKYHEWGRGNWVKGIFKSQTCVHPELDAAFTFQPLWLTRRENRN